MCCEVLWGINGWVDNYILLNILWSSSEEIEIIHTSILYDTGECTNLSKVSEVIITKNKLKLHYAGLLSCKVYTVTNNLIQIFREQNPSLKNNNN